MIAIDSQMKFFTKFFSIKLCLAISMFQLLHKIPRSALCYATQQFYSFRVLSCLMWVTGQNIVVLSKQAKKAITINRTEKMNNTDINMFRINLTNGSIILFIRKQVKRTLNNKTLTDEVFIWLFLSDNIKLLKYVSYAITIAEVNTALYNVHKNPVISIYITYSMNIENTMRLRNPWFRLKRILNNILQVTLQYDEW